ncbi:MAG: hypothetical protein Harvfovirus4_56 [Harvfovirus sp.]|uniref:Uncharacterized protein n=1 Tax=Harvfovirus sp. TaxID=2487768 RepID=A0A3G5A0K0_9VIRU|nr:MAG: hypothetical protein Harvfovirus4_56 [Harvfovirus sp.]
MDYAFKGITPQRFNEIESFCKEMHILSPKEDLAKVIATDNLLLHNLGISHKQITDMLKRIIYHHKYFDNDNSFDVRKEVDNYTKFKILNGFQIMSVRTNFVLGRYGVIGIRWNKTFVCCFNEKDEVGSCDYIISNGKDRLHFDELQLHQIEMHHFFQGNKSFRRLDPATVVKFLPIRKNICYETKFEVFDLWEFSSYCDMFTFELNRRDGDNETVVGSIREKSYDAKLISDDGSPSGDVKLLVHIFDPKFAPQYIDLFGARAYIHPLAEKKSGTYYFIGKTHKKILHQDEMKASATKCF